MSFVKAIFIVDANTRIGFGHLNRCNVLAQELRSTGLYEIFFSFEDTDKLTEETFRKEFGILSREDLLTVSGTEKKLLIIDSLKDVYYGINFQKHAIEAGYKIMHFAVSDQFEYYSDLILNPNIHALKLSFRVIKQQAKVLLGPQFFIFRDEFRNAASTRKISNQKNPVVLISFGAADPNDFSSQVADLLCEIGAKQSYKIITGPLYKGKIKEHSLPENIEHFSNPASMVELMLKTDFAICSFGSTFWELASLKIPSFVIATSQREIYTYDYVKNDSIFIPLGSYLDSDITSRIKESLMKIEDEDAPLSMELSEFDSLIDVNGVERIVSHINQLFN